MTQLIAKTAIAPTAKPIRGSTGHPLFLLLRPLTSLRLTVTLFAMSIFLVFAGTLAQVDRGIWTIMDEYFRTFIAWIDLRIFFPRSWNIPAKTFPFPGGWLIGAALLTNLILAHSLLFKVKAQGRQLALGFTLLLAGIALTWMVLAGAFQDFIDKFQFMSFGRVLWRLILGEIGALVLLAACILLFSRRAGIVLLHAGIALILVSEMVTGLFAVEATMTLTEGETVNFVDLSQRSELAIIDSSAPEHDTVTVIPGSMLQQRGATIRNDQLPFDVEVVDYFPNSEIPIETSSFESQLHNIDEALEHYRQMPTPPPFLITEAEKARERLLAQFEQLRQQLTRSGVTAGAGLEMLIQPKPEGTGVGDMARDAPGLIAILKDKQTQQPLGTYLLSYWFDANFSSRFLDVPQVVRVGDRSYTLYFRPERVYKPYALHLINFHHETYLGTEIPKDFSSFVKVYDAQGNEDREVRIWMNTPLRYAGETFYQSAFIPGDRGTILQVVKNVGWMIPYVACMIVATGLIAHMGNNLFSFLQRRLAA